MAAKCAFSTFWYSENIVSLFNRNSGDIPWIYERLCMHSKIQWNVGVIGGTWKCTWERYVSNLGWILVTMIQGVRSFSFPNEQSSVFLSLNVTKCGNHQFQHPETSFYLLIFIVSIHRSVFTEIPFVWWLHKQIFNQKYEILKFVCCVYVVGAKKLWWC